MYSSGYLSGHCLVRVQATFKATDFGHSSANRTGHILGAVQVTVQAKVRPPFRLNLGYFAADSSGRNLGTVQARVQYAFQASNETQLAMHCGHSLCYSSSAILGYV